MEPLLIILIPGLLGGLVLALLIASGLQPAANPNHRRAPASGEPVALADQYGEYPHRGPGRIGDGCRCCRRRRFGPAHPPRDDRCSGTWCRACARPDRDETTHRRAAVQRRRSRRPTNAEHRRRAAAHVSRARAGTIDPVEPGRSRIVPVTFVLRNIPSTINPPRAMDMV